MSIIAPSSSAIILAGGRGKRVGGKDKGLLAFNNRKIIEYVIDAIRPVAKDIVISANRNIETYKTFGHKVISDETDDYQGPLAGLYSALPACKQDNILVAPCDMPFLTTDLFQTLADEIKTNAICIAESNGKLQPVFIMKASLRNSVKQALDNDDLQLMKWIMAHQPAVIKFTSTSVFQNKNHTEDFSQPLDK